MKKDYSKTIDEILEAIGKIEHLKKISRTDYSVVGVVMEVAQNKGCKSLHDLYHKEKYKKTTKDGKIIYEHATVWRTIEKAQILGYVSKIKEKKKVIIKLKAKGKKMIENISEDFNRKNQKYIK